MEFKQGEKIVGIDPDIADALGKQLGVKFEFTSGTFDTLLGALPTGRYDAVMSSVSDTKARQQGLDKDGKKTGTGVDFVDYYTASTGILVKKGNPEGIKSTDDLCGKKIAVQRGTTYEQAAKDLAAKCEKDGKGKLDFEPYATDAEAQTRVKAKRRGGRPQRLPRRRVHREDRGRRRRLRGGRQQVGRGPLRHRGGQEEHPAA